MFILTILSGCAHTSDENIQRGNAYSYQPGYPEMYSSAFGYIDDGVSPVVKVNADVPYNSLVYKESKDEKLKASILVEISIISNNNGKQITNFYSYSFDLVKEDSLKNDSYRTFSINKNYPLYFGKHTITINITDVQSGKSVSNTHKTLVPDPKNDLFLTDIMLYGKNSSASNEWKNITGYSVTQEYDSLKFFYQVNNNESPVQIVNELIYFESNTDYAQLPFFRAPIINKGSRRGIFYDKSTVIESSNKTYSGKSYQNYELSFGLPKRGNYRFNIQIKTKSTSTDNHISAYQARDFGVKSANYPHVKTPQELAAPLIYLMDEEKYKEIMSLNNPDSLKAEVDAFWLKDKESTQKARETLKLYYERVEEANRYFSNFKEGWKTDRGMIYIIFGPPMYDVTHIDEKTWIYSYDWSDAEYSYSFLQPVMPNRYYPFEHWILKRSRHYFNIFYQQSQLWKTGSILDRKIF